MKHFLRLFAIVAVVFGTITTAGARDHHRHHGQRYVKYHTSCGCPVYHERYVAFYDSCGHPVFRTRRVPVVHRCGPVVQHYRHHAHGCEPVRPHRRAYSSRGVQIHLPIPVPPWRR